MVSFVIEGKIWWRCKTQTCCASLPSLLVQMDLSDFYLASTRSRRPPAAGWGWESGCCWSGFEYGPPASPWWRRSSSSHRRLQTQEGNFNAEHRASLSRLFPVCRPSRVERCPTIRKGSASFFLPRLPFLAVYGQTVAISQPVLCEKSSLVSAARHWTHCVFHSENKLFLTSQRAPAPPHKLSGQSHPLFPTQPVSLRYLGSAQFWG